MRGEGDGKITTGLSWVNNGGKITQLDIKTVKRFTNVQFRNERISHYKMRKTVKSKIHVTHPPHRHSVQVYKGTEYRPCGEVEVW